MRPSAIRNAARDEILPLSCNALASVLEGQLGKGFCQSVDSILLVLAAGSASVPGPASAESANSDALVAEKTAFRVPRAHASKPKSLEPRDAGKSITGERKDLVTCGVPNR